MASLRKTKYGTWEVLWMQNKKLRSKSFKTKTLARQFQTIVESSPADLGKNMTFESLAREYEEKFTDAKKSAKSEHLRINTLLSKASFAKEQIKDVTQEQIQSYIIARRNDPGAKSGTLLNDTTIVKELHLISAIFNYGIRSQYCSRNPTHDLRDKPKESEHRERVASEEDIERLLHVVAWDAESVPKNKEQLVVAAFLFACRTGMRVGEILKMEESWIDGDVIHIPKDATKTASKRDVAVPDHAMKILRLVMEIGERPRFFGGVSSASRDALWRKVRDKAGLGAVVDSSGSVVREGLNFHDSRATFATWAASINPKTGAPRLDVLALARQTGHKDLKMLQRYYRPSASDMARILNDSLEPDAEDE